MSGREVYAQAAVGAFRIFLVRLAWTALAWWLVGPWRLGAIIMFALLCFFTVRDAIMLVALPGDTGKLAAGLGMPGPSPEDQRWLRRAETVRRLSVVAAAALLVLLYTRIW